MLVFTSEEGGVAGRVRCDVISRGRGLGLLTSADLMMTPQTAGSEGQVPGDHFTLLTTITRINPGMDITQRRDQNQINLKNKNCGFAASRYQFKVNE